MVGLKKTRGKPGKIMRPPFSGQYGLLLQTSLPFLFTSAYFRYGVGLHWLFCYSCHQLHPALAKLWLQFWSQMGSQGQPTTTLGWPLGQHSAPWAPEGFLTLLVHYVAQSLSSQETNRRALQYVILSSLISLPVGKNVPPPPRQAFEVEFTLLSCLMHYFSCLQF